MCHSLACGEEGLYSQTGEPVHRAGGAVGKLAVVVGGGDAVGKLALGKV